MSSLHTISKSWHDATWLYEQLGFAAEGDAILLMQDAVLAAHSPITLASFLAKCKVNGVDVFLLEPDAQMRGIENRYDALKELGFDGFVELVERYEKQVAW